MVSQPDVLNVSITENNYLLSISSLTGGVPPYLILENFQHQMF